ncbi:metallophosphoesterase [Butyrivibrio sp. AE2005]|uniref:metallophosphoesterase n=1 Tax=Butyrivibrio sp. AE2005 TaxID=1496722 RepID=UPI00047B1C4E|nr:metallophosphoesterase [Butyrivibrio sp. AE2005]
MNILKKATGKAFLSLTLATTLFFSPNINGSTAHAGVGPIRYSIDHKITRNFSEIEEKYNNNFSNKTVILTTNDVHGAVDGYPYLAGMKDYFGKLGADVIVVDAGDFSQTKPEATKKYINSKNGLAFKCMNSVGYNYATLGNHEGTNLGDLNKNIADTEKKPKFEIISSNILDPTKGTPLYTSCAIHKTTIEGADNVNIGFFGLTTKDAESSKSKMLLEGAMQECAEAQYNLLKNEGIEIEEGKEKEKADIVICLSHLGLEDEFADRGESSYEIYRKVNQIDLMIDGHSHSIITPPEYGKPLIYKKENGDDVNNDPILSTGTEFQNIGVVIIDNHEKAIKDAFLIEEKVFKSFEPISPENNDAAAATAKVVEEVKKESKNGSKKQ